MGVFPAAGAVDFYARGDSASWPEADDRNAAGHVLVEIARSPDARIRDVSAVVGLTERTVQAIVADLEAAGYLNRTRTGRRTRYTVNHDSLFRHPAQEGHRVGPFLTLFAADGTAGTTREGDDNG
jgi:MarR family